MKNGHLYKMQAMVKHGVPMKEIYHAFRTQYDPGEIDAFLKPTKAPIKKKAAAKKRTLGEEVSDDVGSQDL